ncbi:NAD(P)-dependent oxidoreductase [Kitasatospora sp. NPDC008050]|uniref:NAD(P)-dependent oxidoreductase n=1 Tax=Kitasatospora sp. NPDC008050 TaxID=3364021 RepID=UPI0036E4BE14
MIGPSLAPPSTAPGGPRPPVGTRRFRVLVIDAAPDELLYREIDHLLSLGPDITLNLRRVADRVAVRRAYQERVTFTDLDGFDRDGLLDEITRDGLGFDALKTRLAVPLGEALFRAGTAPRQRHPLRVIAQAGPDTAHIDVPAAIRHGIRVGHTPGGDADAVAEFALTQLLSLNRGLAVPRPRQLTSLTLGIVGFGHAGRALSGRATALGMPVVVYCPRSNAADAPAGVQRAESLDELLALCDVVSLHGPRTEQAQRLIGHRELALMRPGSVLINAARESVVDQHALAVALSDPDHPVTGAALDSFADEQEIRASPLFGLDSAFLSPRLAGATHEALTTAALRSSEQLVALLTEAALPPLTPAVPTVTAGRSDPIAGQWTTLPGCKQVLVVVHTLVYGQRLRDLLPLFRADLRTQLVFTVGPHPFNSGVEGFLQRLGGRVLPWEVAVRTNFDLILAAGARGTEQLRGPLVHLPHGVGYLKLSRPDDGPDRTVAGLGRRYLTWDGRVVPAALALAHRNDAAELARCCPEALPIASVVGDASYDRIAAELPRRAVHRRALGLREDERLLLVCSTWGSGSLFQRIGSLLPRLRTELPAERYRIALLLHPNVWAGHGGWQIRSWLGNDPNGHPFLIEPELDWRPLLIAADFIIGDHGSLTLYGAMTSAPILISHDPQQDVNPRSPGARLARTGPWLSARQPLDEQLERAATEYRRERYRPIAEQISSEPGRFNRNMRGLLYRLLLLDEPNGEPPTEPLELPVPLAEQSHRRSW